MNVVESRAGRPLCLRPWVLLLGAAVIVAATLYLATGSSRPTHPDLATGSGGASHPAGPVGSRANAFSLMATNPAPGAQNVPPNTTITVTFSAPVSLRGATPQLSPAIGGEWVRTSASTLSYDLATPLIPATRPLTSTNSAAVMPMITPPIAADQGVNALESMFMAVHADHRARAHIICLPIGIAKCRAPRAHAFPNPPSNCA